MGLSRELLTHANPPPSWAVMCPWVREIRRQNHTTAPIMSRFFLAINSFALCLAAILSLTVQVSAQNPLQARKGRETVELDPPAVMKIAPMVAKPLQRGEEMPFSLTISGAPERINMWSARIDYTSDTLNFKSLYTGGDERQTAVVISDPIPVADGWETRQMSGISLPGWADGEVVRLTFEVREDAPETASIRLFPHPTVEEGLAHDSTARGVTIEYSRELDDSATQDMQVTDVTEDNPAYDLPTPTPRVLFRKDSD